ncbi:MAG: dienelactone hydrolase family protein [Xenophilus sp.]
MSSMIPVTCPDGHVLSAYLARPEGTPRGGILVASELFGVTHHIRDVADSYARDGYLVACPQFYDRYRRDSVFSYDQAGLERARELLQLLDFDKVMVDCRGVVAALRCEGVERIGMVGYCSGGTSAWLASEKVAGLACSAAYYGSLIPKRLEIRPAVPVMAHWGASDHTLALEEVRVFERAHPEVESFVYDTGHGFNCDRRAHHYHAPSAALARERTLAFFRTHVG